MDIANYGDIHGVGSSIKAEIAEYRTPLVWALMIGKARHYAYQHSFFIGVFLPLSLDRAMIAGGGAPETEIAQKLTKIAVTTPGMDQYCFRAFADSFAVIPYTLAANAGLNPIETITELRTMHAEGHHNAGIDARKVSSGTVNNRHKPPLSIFTSSLLSPLRLSAF